MLFLQKQSAVQVISSEYFYSLWNFKNLPSVVCVYSNNPSSPALLCG